VRLSFVLPLLALFAVFAVFGDVGFSLERCLVRVSSLGELVQTVIHQARWRVLVAGGSLAGNTQAPPKQRTLASGTRGSGGCGGGGIPLSLGAAVRVCDPAGNHHDLLGLLSQRP
jgi:hypothetical protein